MKANKKRIPVIGIVIAAMFIIPLIAFAIIYRSSDRKNSFSPGSVDIAVNEGGSDEGEELTKNYEWEQDDGDYIADKNVRVKDSRENPGEVLRVTFIPMWYDMDENGDITDVYSGVFNFNNVELSGNTLIYCDHDPNDGDDHTNDKTITLYLVSDWQEKGWSYQSSDRCFYYSGALYNDKLTAQLLDSVVLNANAYELTADHVFRLDVLADAIQSSGEVASERSWEIPQ